ncbi:PH domain-containing protein [Phycisphaeraceae bacterium AH-315-B13]|nr:PH domain-containing protein [Phycisphaeraceae bacterium AH-315-B13]
MREEIVLEEAVFDSAVKYYVIATAIPLTLIIVGIPFLIIVLPLVYLIRTIEYRNIQCTLLERSLRVRRGVFNKVEKTIPLDKITDLGVLQGPVMRYCGVDAINVETAGQSGVGSALVHLVGIRDAKAFRDAVLEQRDRLADGKIAQASPEAVETSHESTDLIREIRDTLSRIEKKMGN